jgi:hypothetical protein
MEHVPKDDVDRPSETVKIIQVTLIGSNPLQEAQAIESNRIQRRKMENYKILSDKILVWIGIYSVVSKPMTVSSYQVGITYIRFYFFSSLVHVVREFKSHSLSKNYLSSFISTTYSSIFRMILIEFFIVNDYIN